MAGVSSKVPSAQFTSSVNGQAHLLEVDVRTTLLDALMALMKRQTCLASKDLANWAFAALVQRWPTPYTTPLACASENFPSRSTSCSRTFVNDKETSHEHDRH